MSSPQTLENLACRLRAFRDARDWSRFHSPKNLALSVSIEAAELLEQFQWKSELESLSPAEVASAADEAADVLIYLLLLCDRLGIDLGASTAAKIDRNEGRFPISEPVDGANRVDEDA